MKSWRFVLILLFLFAFPPILRWQQATEAADTRPMTEPELLLLIQGLEPVELGEGKGWAIAAVVKGSSLPSERMALLLGDTMAVLAELRAKETLDRLKRTPGTTKSALAGAERALNFIRDRARARFAGRGGEEAHAISTRLVTAHRAALERVLRSRTR